MSDLLHHASCKAAWTSYDMIIENPHLCPSTCDSPPITPPPRSSKSDRRAAVGFPEKQGGTHCRQGRSLPARLHGNALSPHAPPIGDTGSLRVSGLSAPLLLSLCSVSRVKLTPAATGPVNPGESAQSIIRLPLFCGFYFKITTGIYRNGGIFVNVIFGMIRLWQTPLHWARAPGTRGT